MRVLSFALPWFFLITPWVMTQSVAAELRYASWLGTPLFAHTHIYNPYLFPVWLYKYAWYYPVPFQGALLVGATVAIIGVVVTLFLRLWMPSRSARSARQTYGTHTWATEREIRRALLRSPQGPIVGVLRRRYLRYGGPSNVWVCAPPRQYKTRGMVFPTLLTYPHSVLVHDIRSECWETTAGFRAHPRGLNQRTLRYDPTSLTTARHNPLDEVRMDHNAINATRDMTNIADMLIDPEATKAQRDHWEKTAKPTIIAVGLHLKCTRPQSATLEHMAYFLADPQRPVDLAIKEMLDTHHEPESIHRVIASMARELLNKSPNERSSVISTVVDDYLGIYREPLLANITSTSDFCIRDLQFGPKPLSLYITVPPSDLASTRPLLRIFLNQVGRLLTEEYHAPNRRPLGLILDEFDALGKIDFLLEKAAHMGGYNIWALLVSQSASQLLSRWGDDAAHALLATCDVKVAYTASDTQTAEALTNLLGTTTQMRQQTSYSGERFSPFFSRKTRSMSEVEVPMMTATDFLMLPQTDAVIFPLGSPRIQATKVLFDRDPDMQRRILPPPRGMKPALRLPVNLELPADTPETPKTPTEAPETPENAEKAAETALERGYVL